MSSTGSSGLSPLPFHCWMLNQLFVLPSSVPGTNSLAGGWGNGINRGFIIGMTCLSTSSLLQACAQKAAKPPELLLGFPLCKHIAAGSCHRHWGLAGERVAEAACSCVPSSSAHSRASTSSTCRERGRRWEMG